jgi:hypothetical protein
MTKGALVCYALAVLGAALPARAQHVHALAYVGTLSGASQLPANDSLAVGSARVMIDLVFFTMRVEVEFSGLAGPLSAANLHGNTPSSGQGAANPFNSLPSLPQFPVGGIAGSYDQTISLGFTSSYNPAYIAANGGTVSHASNAFFGALSAGRIYVNLSTATFPDGEIRGFLKPVPPADFDFNGIVEPDDLAIWRQQFAYDHGGDANFDGLTDGSDFLAWQRTLGAIATLPPGLPAGAPAPEPSAGSLLLAAAASRIFAVRRMPIAARRNCRIRPPFFP